MYVATEFDATLHSCTQAQVSRVEDVEYCTLPHTQSQPTETCVSPLLLLDDADLKTKGRLAACCGEGGMGCLLLLPMPLL